MTLPSSLRLKSQESEEKSLPKSLKLKDESLFGKFKDVVSRTSEPIREKISSVEKTIAKGTAEGLGRLGRAMGPTQDMPKIQDDKIIPGKTSAQELEQQTENLDKLLPNEEGFIQKGLRRGLQQAPTALAFPGSKLETLPRSIAAGFMGEGAKELGLPEWAQTAAEITAYIGPDVTKKLLSSGKDAELIEFAKKMGMTDKEITPLIQSDFKQKWLAKISTKGSSTEKALGDTKSAINKVADTLQNSKVAATEIVEKENGKLINGLFEKLNKVPREIRDKIEKDLSDLLDNKITGSTLINFWRDINSKYGKDKSFLQTLKGPIMDALESISPQLGKDFELSNKLFSKYYPIAKKLKPGLADKIVSAGETIAGVGALGAAAFGNFGPLGVIVGEQAIKKFSQQLLTNPHLQQLSNKMVVAINQNKPMIVKNLAQAFSNQIRKQSPEVASELDKLSLQEIEELFSHETK